MTARPLVAVAHGSRDPAAAAALPALVDEVRRQRPGLVVTGCNLDHARPSLPEAVRETRARTGRSPVVVPLLLTAAFHSRVDVPAQLAATDPDAIQADVLGPDPLLLDALERRLEEAGIPRRDPATAVVLAAAGSADVEAQETVRRLAEHWAGRGWWAVEPAYASAAAPTVVDAVSGLRAQGAPRVAVASYLLAPGLFADRLRAGGADAVS